MSLRLVVSVMGIFPGRNAGASLKPHAANHRGTAPRLIFPGRNAGASLKHVVQFQKGERCGIFPGRNAGASLEYPGRGEPGLKDAPAIFRPQFHSPGHLFHQPMLRRSITKSIQINALNLVGKIGQPSSFGENPPIRREKARPFRPCTIKVSGDVPP